MRNLARNQTMIYYKRLIGKEDVLDDDSNITGDYELIYGELQSLNISVSANKGTTEADAFGTDLDYDRTLSTADMSCDIDENTILWLDGADPTAVLNPDPYNFYVVKCAKSINQIVFAVKAVDVSNAN